MKEGRQGPRLRRKGERWSLKNPFYQQSNEDILSKFINFTGGT